jgi:hypothetical protein
VTLDSLLEVSAVEPIQSTAGMSHLACNCNTKSRIGHMCDYLVGRCCLCHTFHNHDTDASEVEYFELGQNIHGVEDVESWSYCPALQFSHSTVVTNVVSQKLGCSKSQF